MEQGQNLFYKLSQEVEGATIQDEIVSQQSYQNIQRIFIRRIISNLKMLAEKRVTFGSHEGAMAFESENFTINRSQGGVATPGLKASELRAVLIRNSAKKTDTIRSQVAERKTTRVQTPHPKARQTEIQEEDRLQSAIDVQARIVENLCRQGNYDDARETLRSLIRLAPQVTGFASFWEAVYNVERQNVSRAGTVVYMAIDHVTDVDEMKNLKSLIRMHLSTAGAEASSFEDFLSSTTRRLSFDMVETTSPACLTEARDSHFEIGDSPVEVVVDPVLSHDESEPVAEETTPVVQKDRVVRFVEEPIVETIPGRETFSVQSLIENLPSNEVEEEAITPSRAPVIYRRTPHPGRFRPSVEPGSAGSLFASPAVRISISRDEMDADIDVPRPAVLLQSRSPARQRLFGRPASETTDESPKGSIVVLSPVKEPGSAKKNATPVRRSLRHSVVPADTKNKSALVDSDYSYAPNPILNPSNEVAESSPIAKAIESILQADNNLRRSARKVKSVEKLSPRFGTRSYADDLE